MQHSSQNSQFISALARLSSSHALSTNYNWTTLKKDIFTNAVPSHAAAKALSNVSKVHSTNYTGGACSAACMFGEEEDEFAHHGPIDLLDKLDVPMDLQVADNLTMYFHI